MDTARAWQIADEVLFPAALDVDRAERVPRGHFDLLAADGFYSIDDQLGPVVEAFASGCLSTTFVWLQHHQPLRDALALGRDDLAPALASGERRAGIALAGARSGSLRVRAEGASFVLDGTVPWVTGYGMIDTMYVAARDTADVVHFLLVDAIAAPGVTMTPLDLVAVQASGTVNVTFSGYRVPDDRLLRTQPYHEWRSGDSGGSVTNGYLALGIANRCVRLLRAHPYGGPEAEPLAAALDAARTALASGDPSGVADARAAASELALRAATTLTVLTGARAVLRDEHAQRLVREATFTLVFGSRPGIRDATLGHLRRPL